MLWSLLRIALAVYVGLTLLLFLIQWRLVWFPSREMALTPDSFGIAYEPVWFQTADGVKLSAWFVPVEKPRAVVLFCHGNAGNISNLLDTIQIFRRLGLSSLVFDYRGYGQSEGKPTERGTYLDAEAAWDYLVGERKVPPNQIVVFGRSLGGPIAAWLAKGRTPAALVLESTHTSAADVGAKVFPFLPVRLICRIGYRTLDYVKHVTCPTLVVHSPQDELIPFSHGRRLFAAANEPKEFLEISGDHNEGFLMSGPHYTDGLSAFISRRISAEKGVE